MAPFGNNEIGGTTSTLPSVSWFALGKASEKTHSPLSADKRKVSHRSLCNASSVSIAFWLLISMPLLMGAGWSRLNSSRVQEKNKTVSKIIRDRIFIIQDLIQVCCSR